MGVLDLVRPKTITKEEATAEVARLQAVEVRYSELARQKTQERRLLEDHAGDDVAGFDEATIFTAARERADAIIRVSVDVDAATRAAEAARMQRRGSIPLIWAAEAAVLRQRAATLRREADDREPKARKLLEALQEFEACTYAPSQPPMAQYGSEGVTGGTLTVIRIPTPKTTLLRQEAAQLEAQAKQLEEHRVQDWGHVSAVGADALVAEVLADPLMIGPSLLALQDWIEQASAAELARRARLSPGQVGYVEPETPIAFSVAWTRGVLASHAQVSLKELPISSANGATCWASRCFPKHPLEARSGVVECLRDAVKAWSAAPGEVAIPLAGSNH
jgi:hypothetical protein